MLAPPASVWVIHADADRSRPFHPDYGAVLAPVRRSCAPISITFRSTYAFTRIDVVGYSDGMFHEGRGSPQR